MITGARYRGEALFARPICDLACQFRSANPRPGPNKAGASESTLRMFLDKKTLHCVVINIPFLGRFAVGSPGDRSPGPAGRGGARSIAPAPRNLSHQPSLRET